MFSFSISMSQQVSDCVQAAGRVEEVGQQLLILIDGDCSWPARGIGSFSPALIHDGRGHPRDSS